MDPETTRDTMVALAQEILSDEDASDEAIELAEQVQALDEWLMRGGLLPSAWRTPRG